MVNQRGEEGRLLNIISNEELNMLQKNIYVDKNGVSVDAVISRNGCDVEGHVYTITHGITKQEVRFQLGAVLEAGVNGATNEAFLETLIHRTEFLNDKFPCPENELAIYHMSQALDALNSREMG